MSAGQRRKITTGGKGHAEQIAALVAAVKAAGRSLIPLASVLATTRATFRVREAIASAAHGMPTRTPR